MIKIDNISKDFSSYISTQNSTRQDFIVGFIALALSYFCWTFYIPFAETSKYTTDITLGYSVKQDEKGNYYVSDSGPARLICFDEDSNIKYEVDDVSDGESSGLTIIDFCVDNGLTYVSVGEADGMLLTKEAILVFDKTKYVRTITKRDYSDEVVRMNRFHGITVKDNILRYVEAQQTGILIHNVNLETDEDQVRRIGYFEFFNSPVVSAFFDEIVYCKFNGDKLYILDKFGIIRTISEGKIEEVYSTKWPNEKERIPYQMAISEDGEIYFLDIRGREIVKVDTAAHSTKNLFKQIDSVTLNLGKSDNDFLVVDASGMKVLSNEGTKTFLTLNENFNQIAFKIICNCMEIILLLSLLLLAYRAYIIISNKKFADTKAITFTMLALIFIVSLVIYKIQIDEFTNTYSEEIKSKLELSAYSLASAIPPGTLEKINDTEDYNSETYMLIRRLMKDAFPMNVDISRQLYCDILRFDESNNTAYSIYSLDESVSVYFPITSSDEIEDIKRLYQENQASPRSLPQIWNMDIADSYGSFISLKIPIYDAGRVAGVLSLGTPLDFMQQKMRDITINMFLSMIVVLMVVWFGIAETVAWIDGKQIFDRAIDKGNTKALPIHFIRLLIFFVYGCANLSATFLPVWLINNSTEFQGEELEFMAALPFTVNIFVIGIMSLVAPMLIRRFGMRFILTVSSLAAFYGNLIFFLIPGSYSIMFFGMLIEGIGNGIIMNATYILLTYIEDEEDKQRSFSVYNIASLAGGNFGFMLGSILAVLLSQRLTFLMIALIWLSMTIMSNVILLQLKNLISTDEETEEEEATESISLRQFLFNRPILSFMILFQNPYILFSGFVIFFAPIFCENQGYSEIVVSILMMINAEAAVLSESNLSERITKLKGNMGMYIAFFLNIAAVMLFVLMNDIFGLTLALIIMGVAAGFGITLEQMWFMKLNPSQRYGEDNAMSIYAFTENIGESLGPMVFARLMTLEPIIASVSTFCAVVGALGFGHMIINKKEIAEFNKTDEEESS